MIRGFFRSVMVILAVVIAAPASADNLVSDMKSVTRFCFEYFETGQSSDVLLARGFSPKGKSFQIRYASSNFLKKRGYHVTPRKKGTECFVTIWGVDRNETQALGAKIIQESKAMGYQKGTFTSRFGDEKAVLEKSGIIVSHIARNTNRSGALATEIIFKREN